MRLKIQSILILSALFLLSIAVNASFFNYQAAPVMFPDSSSYLQFAKSLSQGHFPDISWRTFIYPLYLALFGQGNIKLSLYAMIILGAVPILCLYGIAFRITKSRTISFLIAAFLALDFQVINFQSIVLSESLAVLILMLFLYVQITTERIETWPRFFGMIILDVCLIFVRPIFILLPATLYFIRLIFNWKTNHSFNQARVRFCLIGISFNLLAVLAWSSINSNQNGFFGFSAVPNNGLFGKMMQYGYLDKTYPDAPEMLQRVIWQYKHYPYKAGDVIVPQLVFEPVLGTGGRWVEGVRQMNIYLFKKQPADFLYKTAMLLPKILTENRLPYSKTEHLFRNPWFLSADHLFDYLNRFKFIGLVVCVFACVRSLMIGCLDAGRPLLFIVVTCLYVASIIALCCFAEYARLRTPCEYLFNLMTVLPVIFLARFVIQSLFHNRNLLNPLIAPDFTDESKRAL